MVEPASVTEGSPETTTYAHIGLQEFMGPVAAHVLGPETFATTCNCTTENTCTLAY